MLVDQTFILKRNNQHPHPFFFQDTIIYFVSTEIMYQIQETVDYLCYKVNTRLREYKSEKHINYNMYKLKKKTETRVGMPCEYFTHC